MPQQEDWIIINDATSLYFMGYSGELVPLWGGVQNAIHYLGEDGEEQATQQANRLGGGGIHPIHAPTH